MRCRCGRFRYPATSGSLTSGSLGSLRRRERSGAFELDARVGEWPAAKSRRLTMAVPPKNHTPPKSRPYDGSVERPPLATAAQSRSPETRQPIKNAQSGRSLTITTKAWLFGHKIRCLGGQIAKNLATPIPPFLRCQKSS